MFFVFNGLWDGPRLFGFQRSGREWRRWVGKIDIPELEKAQLDESGIDVDSAISSIRKSLGEGRHVDIRVEATATLAVLDFAAFRTWKDLRENWSSFMRNDVVRHLVENAHESFVNLPTPLEGELLCPIACDESQLEAVRWAAEGRSFVLEGPPGTGKSQTIANLIAASMALGKRVLFVAEKQVALEVVARRLNAIGLSPFCIVIHHESVTPDGIRRQLRASLDFEGINLADEWNSESIVIASIIKQLGEYREFVTSTNAVGHSLWKSQQEATRLGPPSRLAIPVASIPKLAEHQSQVEESLLSLQGILGSAMVDRKHPWFLSRRIDFTAFDSAALASCLQRLEEALRASSHLRSLLSAVLGGASTADEIEAMRRALLAAVALDEANRQGRIKPGDRILLVAFGAGLTWASAVIEW